MTARYAEIIATEGVEAAVREHLPLARGVNCWDGHCTYEGVAEGVGVEYTPLAKLLG